MPTKKYTCEYCNRTFNDSLAARKNHFESRAHLLQIQQYYERYPQPQPQPFCPSLSQQGRCELGPERCTYSHDASALSIPSPLQWVRVVRQHTASNVSDNSTRFHKNELSDLHLPPSLRKKRKQKVEAVDSGVSKRKGSRHSPCGWGW